MTGRATPVPSAGQAGRMHFLVSATAAASVLHLARQGVILATLFLTWISLKPFPDLSSPDLADIATGQEALTYLAFGGLAVLGFALIARQHADALRTFLSPAFVALGLWLVLSVVLSRDPGTSVKRLALTGAVMILAACLPLLARSRAELRNLLATAALALLGLCYLGLLLAPDLSMHTVRDFLEPSLAGNWRGSFGHKNAAAAVMAMLVFVGLAVFRSGLVLAGGAIVVLAAVFLVGSEGKSATALTLAVLAITALFGWVRGLRGRVLITLGPLIVINVFSVGTVLNGALAALVQALPIDATFTGRIDVWSFAIDALKARPLTGYGFAAFWNNETVRAAADDSFTWAGYASHSHNSYLDTAVTLGLPGLVLTLLVFVFAPLRDFQRVSHPGGRRDPFAAMFLQIWLFGVLLSSMESFFYDRADPIWFMFAFAVFGLHYLARFGSR